MNAGSECIIRPVKLVLKTAASVIINAFPEQLLHPEHYRAGVRRGRTTARGAVLWRGGRHCLK